ncbi:PASTA domain-containing protein [Deinococcus metalli]|uniref:PASTA domain-containing protein n=1 Tax=Deinococcus metalli TaxID=1141878 RepID=UPI00361221DB
MIVAAVILLGGLGAYLLLGNRQVAVPAVAGQSLVKAQELIAAAGLKVADTPKQESSDTVAQGLVIRTEPEQGTKQAKGTAVTLVASNGPASFPMPNVVGSAASAAVIALQQAGIVKFSLNRLYSNTVPAEQVISTNPDAGQPVTKASEVSVAVSVGPCPPLQCHIKFPPVLIDPNIRVTPEMLRPPSP